MPLGLSCQFVPAVEGLARIWILRCKHQKSPSAYYVHL
jgi:hypothetical protein